MGHDFKKYPELTNAQMQFYYFDSPHRQITEDFEAKVVRVIDGDTIRAEWSERDFDFPIRMLGIAAPEIKERGGAKGKKWLENQILGRNIEAQIDPKQRVGKFGRLLGTIFHLGENINQKSMDEGISIVFGSDEQ